MNNKTRSRFKFAYFIYLSVLVFLAVAAIIYTASVIKSYDNNNPENIAIAQAEEIRKMAASGELWNKFTKPEVAPGKFEKNVDVIRLYETLLADNNLTVETKIGSVEDNSKIYEVKNGERVLAEICLNRIGEEKTKLFILKISEWEVKSIDICISPKDYTVEAPEGVTVQINGITLDESDIDTTAASNGNNYKIQGLYLTPEVVMTDDTGYTYDCQIKSNMIKAVVYDYDLTLPISLNVKVNGETDEGTLSTAGMVKHSIKTKSEPEIVITDLFGNSYTYKSKSEMPLTYLTLIAPDNFNVTVDGNKLSSEGITEYTTDELDTVKMYDDSIEGYKCYSVAILKNDAEIEVRDYDGNSVEVAEGVTILDLSEENTGNSLPDNIAAEVNVLDIAEKWSLFMTADLSLYDITQYLAEGSPVYASAVQWANGIDITFTSDHTLGNPMFTEEKVDNYTALSDISFYVDISFTKEMYVKGTRTPDSMDNRFYFVKINGEWKLVDMN